MKKLSIVLLMLGLTALLFACAPKPTSMTLNPATVNLEEKGATATLEVQFADKNGAPVQSKTPVTWTSSNVEVATVQDGVVTAVGSGEATITATAGDLSATATVVVSIPAAVKIAESEITVTVGESKTVTATVVDANGAVLTGKSVTWSVADAAIAEVADGTITGKAEGTTTVTATFGALTATVKIIVKKAEATPQVAATPPAEKPKLKKKPAEPEHPIATPPPNKPKLKKKPKP